MARSPSALLLISTNPTPLSCFAVSNDIHAILEVKPVIGGLFNEANEQAGNDHVVEISRSLWIRRFGADPAIVGRKIELNGERYQVAGVIDPIFDYAVTTDVWMPLSSHRRTFSPELSPA